MEVDAPKVVFADAVASAKTDILIGDLAKILRGNGVGAESAHGCPRMGRGLQCLTAIWPRSFVHTNRGTTGGLSPLSYLGAHTTVVASPGP